MNVNLSTVAPLLLAVLCITAIGVSATTLESTLETDPQEEIDPSYERLPIGQEDAIALHEQMDSGDQDQSEQGQSQQQVGSDPGEEQVQSQQDEGLGAAEPSLLDWLLGLLLSVLRFLLTLGVIVGLAAVGYRYRERIADAFWGLLQPDDDPADVEYTRSEWPDGSPSNAVERAWVTLVRELDPERPSVVTPGECAERARDANVDDGAAEAIADAFERVEYGGVPASAEEDRAEAAMQNLRRGGVSIGSDRRGHGAGGDD